MFVLHIAIGINFAIAIAESVVIGITKDILENDYPGLWYLVLTNMIVRYMFSVCTFINSDTLYLQGDQYTLFYTLPFFYVPFCIQVLTSLVSFCTLLVLLGYENVNSYYKNTYPSIYGSLVVESVWFWLVFVCYCWYKCECINLFKKSSSKQNIEELLNKANNDPKTFMF
jgi:hypothetical protein